MAAAEFTELTDLFDPTEPSEPTVSGTDDGATKPLKIPQAVEAPRTAEPSKGELAVIRNELTSALHEAHHQRRKRADAVQLLAYEGLVRRSRVSGGLWFIAALALIAAGTWSLLQSVATYDLWQIGAASAAALALVCVVVAIVAWAGPGRARQSLSLRQVRRLAPPEMLSEAWFHAAHEVGTPREYRRAFHGLV